MVSKSLSQSPSPSRRFVTKPKKTYSASPLSRNSPSSPLRRTASSDSLSVTASGARSPVRSSVQLSPKISRTTSSESLSVSENRTPDKWDGNDEIIPSDSLSISDDRNTEELNENAVVPFLAFGTPITRKRNAVWSDFEEAPKSVKPAVIASTQQTEPSVTELQSKQPTTKPTKSKRSKRTFLSPNTAAHAIASTLSSPFNPAFLYSPNKSYIQTCTSPSKRSMAEAALIHANKRRGRIHSPRGKGLVSVLDSGAEEARESPWKAKDVDREAKRRGPHSPLRQKKSLGDCGSQDLSDGKVQKRDDFHLEASATQKDGNSFVSATENAAVQPRKPVRACNPYTLFCNANRERVERENPKAKTQAAVNKILGVEYHNLSPVEIAKWCEQAGRDKIRYEREMDSYKLGTEQQQETQSASIASSKQSKTENSTPLRQEKAKESNESTINNKTTPRSTGKAILNQSEIDTPLNNTSRGRRSCPPQFYHDVVYDNNQNQNDRESPSRLDSPSYGLMEWNRNSNESFKQKLNESVHVQKKQAETKKSDGPTEQEEKAVSTGDAPMKKNKGKMKSDKSLVQKGKADTVRTNSSIVEGKKRRRSRGRNQSSSMLGWLSESENVDAIEKSRAPETTTSTKQPGATDEMAGQSVSEKNSVKNETLSIKELDEMLSGKHRKSSGGAKKAAAQKETTKKVVGAKEAGAKTAKVNTNSTKSTLPAQDPKTFDTKVSDDGRFLVTSLPSAQIAPSQGFIIRMLTESPSNSHDEMSTIGIYSDESVPNPHDAIINRRNAEYKQLLDAEIEKLTPLKQSGQRLNFDDAENKLIDHFRLHVQKHNGRYFRWNFTLRLHEEIDEVTARKKIRQDLYSGLKNVKVSSLEEKTANDCSSHALPEEVAETTAPQPSHKDSSKPDKTVPNAALTEGPASLANETGTKSASSKTSPESPRRSKRHIISSLEQSSGASASDNSSCKGSKPQRALSHKELEDKIEKEQKQKTERAGKATAKKAKAKPAKKPSQKELGETNEASSLGRLESNITEQNPSTGKECSVTHTFVASPESPLRSKRLLSSLYDQSPATEEVNEATNSPGPLFRSGEVDEAILPGAEKIDKAERLESPVILLSGANTIDSQSAPSLLLSATKVDSAVENQRDEPTHDTANVTSRAGKAQPNEEPACEEPDRQLAGQRDNDTPLEPAQKVVAAQSATSATQNGGKPAPPESTAQNASETVQKLPAACGDDADKVPDNPARNDSIELYSQPDSSPNANSLLHPPVSPQNLLRLAGTSSSSQHVQDLSSLVSIHGESMFPLSVVPQAQLLQSRIDSQKVQLLLAERRYQEQLAEIGRLEIEVKIKNERMRAIEQNLLRTTPIASHDRVDDFHPPSHFESVSRTYHSEVLKRRRIRSPSEDEYAGSRYSPRRQSHSLAREDRISTSQKRHPRHDAQKRRSRKEKPRSTRIQESSDDSEADADLSPRGFSRRLKKKQSDYSSDSSTVEYDQYICGSRQQPKRKRKKKVKSNQSHDFSDSSSAEHDQAYRGSSRQPEKKEKIRSRQSEDSDDDTSSSVHVELRKSSRDLRKRPKKKEKVRSRLSDDLSDSASSNMERRQSCHRPKKNKNSRSIESEDSSDASSSGVELESSHHNKKEKNYLKKKKVRPRQSEELSDSASSDMERRQSRQIPKKKKKKKKHRSTGSEKSSVASSSGMELESSRNDISKRAKNKEKYPLKNKDAKNHSGMEPKHSRGRNSGLKNKSPQPSGHLSRVGSPRRAKSGHESPRRAMKGQMSILEGIADNSENPTKHLSSNKDEFSHTEALSTGKPPFTAPDTKPVIHNQTKVDNKMVKKNNSPVATKPPNQSNWLAGDSSDSDWDFEGPMILPPPPI